MQVNKKLIIVALILLSLFMIGSVSAASDTEDIVNSDVNNNEKVSHTTTTNTDTSSENVAKTSTSTDTVSEKNSVSNEKTDNKISSTPDNNVLKSTDNETFTALNDKINTSNEITLENNYTYDDTDNFPDGITINKDITIHGNGKTINANGKSRIFKINGANVIIENLKLINGKADYGGAIACYNGTLNCSNSRFIDNYAKEMGSSIYSDMTTLNIYNTFVTSSIPNKYGQIHSSSSKVNIDNADFVNISSVYAPALYFEESESSITSSRFVNLTADKSAGAIAIRWSGNSYIKGCEFINTKSFKNAGAIMVDYGMESFNATIIDCVFTNASSMIGGAYIQLGGNLFSNNSNFTNNKAHIGGAVYISFTNSTIDNCIFDSNELFDEDSTSCGGAIYCDMSNMTLTNSRFINNSAYLGNAVYACDSWYNITNCLFKNNINAIFTDFDKNQCNLNSNEYNNDSIITNQSFYAPISFAYPALTLTLINNTINVTTLPSRFDLRDWGWITPIKNQGRMGACWTFAFGEALETALLKATGIKYDISENYIQNLQIRYSDFGDLISDEGSIYYRALANVISWLSVGEKDDEYDEIGKLSVYVDSANKIRLQDVYFIMPNTTDYVGDVKKAILNYGAVAIAYASSKTEPYFNVNTSAHYTNESLLADHAVSVIGWDDNFSRDNFLIAPPGDGAWIVKNSWGTKWGDEGYFYLSYYEKSFITPDPDTGIIYPFVACIFSNTIDYHTNYQTDLTGLYGFDSNYTQYSNEFTSEYDDLIAGVGTFFNQSGINYSFDIYVNNKLTHSQSGISEFAGYRTIVLSNYVPIKKGDKFKVIFKSNALPYEAYSRNHYITGMSFVSADSSTWSDITLENKTVCLKVYTVADDSKIINNNDITVDYGSGFYFTVQVVTADGHSIGAGAVVSFNINGKTSTVLTDSNGIAKIKITEVPGQYIITTTYNNQTYKNNLNIINTTNSTTKPTTKTTTKVTKATTKITAKKKTFKRKVKIKKYKATVKSGKKRVSKVWLYITIKGKKYKKTFKVKTNTKGKAVFKIKKLTKKGTYTATIKFKGNKNYKASKKTVKIIIK